MSVDTSWNVKALVSCLLSYLSSAKNKTQRHHLWVLTQSLNEHGSGEPVAFVRASLASQAKSVNERSIALTVLFAEIPEKPTAPAYHLEQTTAGVVVMRMLAQVFGQGIDSFGQQRDLNFGRTGIGLVNLIRLDDLFTLLFLKRHSRLTSLTNPQNPRKSRIPQRS